MHQVGPSADDIALMAKARGAGPKAEAAMYELLGAEREVLRRIEVEQTADHHVPADANNDAFERVLAAIGQDPRIETLGFTHTHSQLGPGRALLMGPWQLSAWEPCPPVFRLLTCEACT